MLKMIKKLFLVPLSLLLLSAWSFALSPFRIGNSYSSSPILESETPKTSEATRFTTPEAEKNASDTSKRVLHNRFHVTSSKIRPGDLLLIRGNTWIDKVIQSITGSSYSHVAGVVGPDEAIEILPFKRTTYQKLETYKGQVDVFTCSSLTDDQRRKIVEHAVQKVGTKYDYILVLWEASRYLLHWVWPYQAGDNSLCSTLWVDAYRKAGIDPCPDIIYPSPGDLGKSPVIQKVESY